MRKRDLADKPPSPVCALRYRTSQLSFTGTAKICHAEPHCNAYVFIWLVAGPLTTTLKPSLLKGAHTIGRLKGRSADDE